MSRDLAERILQDCRGAVGEVRFGFGSKRQTWAFEERHQLDVVALSEELARRDQFEFMQLAIEFHDEFAAVGNAWRIRDRLQALAAELWAERSPELAQLVTENLVDERLAVRHWLVSATLAGPPRQAFDSLERALERAYQPADQWAILARLRSLAEQHAWSFSPETAGVLSNLGRLSSDPEQRCEALGLLARFCGSAGSASLARAARADADATVRAHARELLTTVPVPSAPPPRRDHGG